MWMLGPNSIGPLVKSALKELVQGMIWECVRLQRGYDETGIELTCPLVISRQESWLKPITFDCGNGCLSLNCWFIYRTRVWAPCLVGELTVRVQRRLKLLSVAEQARGRRLTPNNPQKFLSPHAKCLSFLPVINLGNPSGSLPSSWSTLLAHTLLSTWSTWNSRPPTTGITIPSESSFLWSPSAGYLSWSIMISLLWR